MDKFKNIDTLSKKVKEFLENSKNIEYIDPSMFEMIDKNKENSTQDYLSYFLNHLKTLPTISFEDVVRISREVFKSMGREQDFDAILNRLRENGYISKGSLNIEDENCIVNAHESRILLSGTFYDVVLLCHEVAHKMNFDQENKYDPVMDEILFETPPIMMELAANDYVKEHYNIDIDGYNLRRSHVSTIKRNNEVEQRIFRIINALVKDGKLDYDNLYRELSKDSEIVEYFDSPIRSIERAYAEGVSDYSYDIGYILGNYANKRGMNKEILDIFLRIKEYGNNEAFTIDENVIKEALNEQGITLL